MLSCRASASAFLCLAALSACGKPSIKLPNRADPAVRLEEARISTLLANSPGHGLLDSAEGATCKVRLLRKVGTTDYVWATCKGPSGAADLPVRITGREVTVPADGDDTGSANALSRIFPKDIAKAINADEARYKP